MQPLSGLLRRDDSVQPSPTSDATELHVTASAPVEGSSSVQGLRKARSTTELSTSVERKRLSGVGDAGAPPHYMSTLNAVVNNPHHLQAAVNFQRDLLAERDDELARLRHKFKTLKKATRQLYADAKSRKSSIDGLPPSDTGDTALRQLLQSANARADAERERAGKLAEALAKSEALLGSKNEAEKMLVGRNIELQKELHAEKRWSKRWEQARRRITRQQRPPTVQKSLWSSALSVVVPAAASSSASAAGGGSSAADDTSGSPAKALDILTRLRRKNDRMRAEAKKTRESLVEARRRYEALLDRNRQDRRATMEAKLTLKEKTDRMSEDIARAADEAAAAAAAHRARVASLEREIETLKNRHREETDDLVAEHASEAKEWALRVEQQEQRALVGLSRVKTQFAEREQELVAAAERARQDFQRTQQSLDATREGYRVQKKADEKKISARDKRIVELESAVSDAEAKRKRCAAEMEQLIHAHTRALEQAEQRQAQSLAVLRARLSIQAKKSEKNFAGDTRRLAAARKSALLELKAARDQARRAKEAADMEVEQLRSAAQTARERAEKLKDESNARVLALESAMESAKEETSRRASRVEHLEKSAAELQNKISAMESERARLESSLAEQRQRMVTLEADAKRQIDGAAAAAAAAEASIAQLRAQISDEKTVIKDLQTQASAEKARWAEAEKLRSTAAEKERKSLESRVRDLEKALSQANARADAAAQQVRSAADVNEADRKRAEEAEAVQQGKTQATTAALEAKVKAAQAAAAAAEESLSDLREKLKDAREKLKRAESDGVPDATQRAAQREALERQLETEKKKSGRLASQLAAARDHHKSVKTQLKSAREAAAALRHTVSARIRALRNDARSQSERQIQVAEERQIRLAVAARAARDAAAGLAAARSRLHVTVRSESKSVGDFMGKLGQELAEAVTSYAKRTSSRSAANGIDAVNTTPDDSDSQPSPEIREKLSNLEKQVQHLQSERQNVQRIEQEKARKQMQIKWRVEVAKLRRNQENKNAAEMEEQVRKLRKALDSARADKAALEARAASLHNASVADGVLQDTESTRLQAENKTLISRVSELETAAKQAAVAARGAFDIEREKLIQAFQTDRKELRAEIAQLRGRLDGAAQKSSGGSASGKRRRKTSKMNGDLLTNGGASSPAQSAMSPAEARAALEALYKKHKPSMLPRIGDLLRKYKGNEASLVRKATAKYEARATAAAGGGTSSPDGTSPDGTSPGGGSWLGGGLVQSGLKMFNLGSGE